MRHIPHDVTIISGDSVIIQLNIKTSSFNIIFPSLPWVLYIRNSISPHHENQWIYYNREIIWWSYQSNKRDCPVIVYWYTVPSSVSTNKVETHPKPKRQVIDESEKSSDGNNESIIDVLDSLIRIFDPDYEPEEDMGKHFSISNIFPNFPKAVV